MADRPDTGGDVAERRSWQLGLAVAIVVLLIFLAGILTRTSPAFESWQAQLPVTLTGLLTPGSLTPAHQRFGARCSTCHRDAFTTVGNDTCVECHKAVAGHRTKAEPAAGNTPEPPCIDCHITHRNKAAVVDARSAPCIDCHIRQEARLAANRDFGKAHAPFRLTLFNGKQETRLRDDAATVPRENSGLKFSHAAHLKADGVSSPEGQTILGCTSCHRPDAAGLGFTAPRMDAGCQQSGCHRARFAEPMRGVVPHASVRVLMDRMRGFFAARLADDPAEFRQHCAGASPAGSTGRRLLDCANELARGAAARSIFRQAGDDPGCALCHELSETGQREAPWKIEPVRWTAKWHASANFPHAKHSTIRCNDCHSKSSSKEAADVSIPGIAACRQCHDGTTPAPGRLATGCADCHAFHRHAAALAEGTQ